VTLAIGLLHKEASPVNTTLKGLVDNNPNISLIVVPEFPQSKFSDGSKNLPPLPSI